MKVFFGSHLRDLIVRSRPIRWIASVGGHLSRQWKAEPMEVTDALEEALKRWGEAAAIYRDQSRQPAHYEVGYFGRKGNGLVFYAMGRGDSLELALRVAPMSEDQEVSR